MTHNAIVSIAVLLVVAAIGVALYLRSKSQTPPNSSGDGSAGHE